MSKPSNTNRRLAMIALLIIGVAWTVARGSGHAASIARPSQAEDEATELRSERVGSRSCAARGCHGAVAPTEPSSGSVFIKDGAFTTWQAHDPHRKAHDVLLQARSIAIADKLKASLQGKKAHESRTCLVCHSTTASTTDHPNAAVLANGIDCEGCHNPASRWLEPHVSQTWAGLTAQAKADQGMRDLSQPAVRAGSCVPCHVGDRAQGMDVNHDMIAAGHPRLNFEYASYLSALPRHWREPHEKALDQGKPAQQPVDFEARSWAIGQIVTSRAVLRLLADRARDSMAVGTSPWPEFSEYECFACHHSLSQPAYLPDRQGVKPGLGRLPWASWSTVMLPVLAGDQNALNPASPESFWSTIARELARGEPDPAKVIAEATEGVKKLDQWLARVESEPFPIARVQKLSKTMASGNPPEGATWDEAAQRYLALSALVRALHDLGDDSPDPSITEAIKLGPSLLAFPPSYDSPRGGRLAPKASPP